MQIKNLTIALTIGFSLFVPAKLISATVIGIQQDLYTQQVAEDSLGAVKNTKGDSIVKTALQYLGTRYRRGQSGPNGFDCSGFTSYVYGKENIRINRSSRSQFTQGTVVSSIGELQKGDLVFFGGSSSPRSVGHVGIVTDVDPETNKFKFIHASRTGIKVDESTSAYYSRRYLGARRIVQE